MDPAGCNGTGRRHPGVLWKPASCRLPNAAFWLRARSRHRRRIRRISLGGPDRHSRSTAGGSHLGSPSNSPSARGNCVLTMGDGPWSPTGEDLEPANWQSTRNWLSQRQYADRRDHCAPGIAPALRQDLIPSTLREASEPASLAAESASLMGRSSVDSRPETTQAPVTTGGVLTVDMKGPRWIAAPIPWARSRRVPDAPPPSIARDEDPARWQLAGDQRGGVLFRIPVGQGAVYVLLDEFAWTNTGLDHGDNARVLAELLGREIRGGVFALDEYRHGHGRAESFLTYLLNLPGSSAAHLACRHLGAALLLWSKRPPQAGRSLRGAGTADRPGIYRRGRPALRARSSRAPGRRGGGPAASPALAILGRTPALVEALLQSAENYTKTEERPASPSAAIHLVRQLIQLRKQIYGTRTVS